MCGGAPPASVPWLEWAALALPLPGQTEIGDRDLVLLHDGGALLAVVDGLGHGADASHASAAAVASLAADPCAPVDTLLQRCHEALRSTRGAVVSVASIDPATSRLTWAGVGDVEGVVVHAGAPAVTRDWIVPRGGVVGYNLPRVRTSTVALRPGDYLVFWTDGIAEGFIERMEMRGPCRALAERILVRHRKGTDDALVLVARFQPEWAPRPGAPA